jgi:cephalosporin-C deacetylase-like acetyl esterase
MMRTQLRFFLLFLLLNVFTAQSQQIILFQNHENGIYKSGDKARIVAFLQDKSTDSVTVKIQTDFTKWTTEKYAYTGDSMVIFDDVLDKTVTMVFEVASKSESGSIGLICNPDKFLPGTQRPKDFDRFWKNQIKTQRALPIQVVSKSVAVTAAGYSCYDVELNSTASEPARGYFAKPQNAKPRSLPIVIYFHAAGVKGDWCRSEPGNALRYATMGKGALCFDLNAHGMLNGQPESYYADLENNELKNYPQFGAENKEQSYFLGMYLRLLRTIDYMTKQPEWDRKRILVLGESQGGGQSLIAAGLDKRVKAVVATVPAMCDWGGTLVGRKGSWPYLFSTSNNREKMLANVPYFDAAHALKNCKATLVVEVGLIDQTCPSSAIFAALNQAKGKKIILTAPYRAHHLTQTAYKPLYNKTIAKSKDDFIKDFLSK